MAKIKGGKNIEGNLQVFCKSCNASKSESKKALLLRDEIVKHLTKEAP